jgi:hypothetical protein
MRNDLGPDWKVAWKDEKTGDQVHLHEEGGLVLVDLAERCDFHSKESFCVHCVKRIEVAGMQARHCVDPRAIPEVQVVEKAVGQWADFMALINPIAKNAFAMRFDIARKLSSTKMIYSAKRENLDFPWKLQVIDYTTTSQVCDSNYIKSFRVRLQDGFSQPYVERLWKSKFTFMIDGEKLIKEVPFRDLLGMKEVLLPKVEEACLFQAGSLDNDNNARADVPGYMLPNGSRIQAEMVNVPMGGGLIKIDIEFDLVSYTTKGESNVKRKII